MNLRLFGEFTLVCPLLLLAGLLSGCFSSSDSKNISGIAVEALPPVFLTGPAAAVLTNAGAFSAHVVMSNHLRMPKTVSGELFARAGKLLFAAEPGKADKKNSGGAFGYSSDMANHQSFVWSEALQGYAQTVLNISPTNLVIQQVNEALQKMDGHVCDSAQAVVQMSDGSSAAFSIFRALDLNRFPIRISSLSNAAPFSLTFSKIRTEPPPADLFTPPTDFTKYNSPEVMVTELIMRQHNLRRHSTPPSETIYDSQNRK